MLTSLRSYERPIVFNKSDVLEYPFELLSPSITCFYIYICTLHDLRLADCIIPFTELSVFEYR